MRIAIPVDDNGQDLCVSFGRTPCFLIADTQGNSQTLVSNPAADAEGGAGIKAAQCVVDSGAEALITIRCGENAAQVLQAAGITIYQSQGKTAQENLSALAEGKLQVMTHFHAGFHGIQ